jgi:hypothetical protein
MVLRPISAAISLASLASVINMCAMLAAFGADQQLIALNAPVRAASEPAVQQVVDNLSKNGKKSGQSKRGTIFNSQPANDSTVVKYRKDNDKVLILGGAEVLPM